MKHALMKLLFGGTTHGTMQEIGLTLLRLLTGLCMAMLHGWGKFREPDKFMNSVVDMGFPMPTAFGWAAILSELVGGVFLAIGLATRPSAFFIAFTMGVAAFVRHGDDPFGKKELPLMFMAVAILFVIMGAGRFSIDRFIRGKS